MAERGIGGGVGVHTLPRHTPRLVHPKRPRRNLGDKLHMLALLTQGPRYIQAIETVVDYLLNTAKSV